MSERRAAAMQPISVGRGGEAGDLEQVIRTGVAALEAERKPPSPSMLAGELDVEPHRRYPNELAVAEFREALRSIG